MADWDEIKRLAADFQRAQTSDTLQRLSERNIIDIVKKLNELRLIELIYTCDGREFITPEHLKKEIEDEVYVNSGRMHLHDLATKLNVDYQHIENKAKELDDEYSLILGQLIHSTYKLTLGKQINDSMLMTGQLSIAEFAKSLDLPSEFLLTVVKEILPRVMDDYVVSQDERTYYTTDMMDRYKSIITGTLSAITKPTTIASLSERFVQGYRTYIPERIFLPIVDGLIKEGRIDASVENRLFIPAIYARKQNEWINKFYSSNSYIEYDVLSRMDIKQPKAFLKKRFPDGIALKTCFISPDLLSQVESLIEDTIVSNGFIEISTILPSSIESDDIEQMLQDIFKKNKQFNSSCRIFDRTNVCSLGYIEICRTKFIDLMQTKAQEHLKQGKLINYFLGGKLKEPNKNKEPNKENTEEVEKATTEEAAASGADEIKEVPLEEKSVAQIIEEETISKANRRGGGKDKKAKIEAAELDDSDDDQGGKKSKGRKSGGGLVGREVKQKAVKKKYLAGKKADLSDDESAPTTKGPRSNKGRAARRGISPERPPTMQKSRGPVRSSSPIKRKEPLIFMSTDELVRKLRVETRNSGECSEEFYESIANLIEDELNKSYGVLAKQTLDEYLKAQVDDEQDPSKVDELDLVN